ncbi:ABC transporter permease [Pseudolabrys taiwanensis]|nr:ABC transporter permease [Pseudolabrys taiwanensis]
MTVPTVATANLRPLALSAGEDLWHGIWKWDLWGRLGWLEIRRRYKRTLIGPFWTSVSLFVFVVVLGTVGSGLLSKNTHEYLPFLASGMIVWVMMSSILTESGSVFIAGAPLLRQKQFEYSLLVYALVWRNAIVFAHNMSIYAIIFLIFAPEKITFNIIIFAIPGMAFVLLNAIWITLLIGLITARFRDIQQIIQTIVQISMFVTPIFWHADNLSGFRRIIFVGFNPLYHLISIVRDPLLGETPRLNSWIAVAIITAAGWTVTYILYSKFRKRIPYWL